MHDLVVRPLQPDQLAIVFPLVREIMPSLTLPSWLRYARRLFSTRRSARSGMVVAMRGAESLPCGIFCWRREQDPARGEIILAEHFVAVDILDPRPVQDALLRELERMGRELGCVTVRSIIHNGSAELTTRFFEAGHRPAGALLSKDLCLHRGAAAGLG